MLGALGLLTVGACGAAPETGPVDLLITGGRVMDPDSGLDAVVNVAVRNGVIVALTEETPEALEVLDAGGLVVAPGFIDLHAHGQDPESSRYQARDGVTTAMELEIGVYPVDPWYAAREGRALIHFGASVSHQGARREAFGVMVAERSGQRAFSLGRGGASDAFLYEAASEDELHRLIRLMQRELDQGGLGDVKSEFGDLDKVGVELERMEGYIGSLQAMGLGDFVDFDLRIVRGLAYYTGIVFEIFDRKGESRSICGGGRYDNLLELVGGDPLPAVGFGMGDVVLGELLRELDLADPMSPEVDYFIVIIGEEHRELAYAIARSQRDKGAGVQYALREQPVRKQFTAAGNAGARQVIVLGPDEVARECAVLRDMASGEEREVPLKELR